MTTYAVLQYHLIDFRVALIRTGAFIAVYTGILLVLFNLSSKENLWKFSPWITLLLASAAPFIFIYLRRVTEALVLKDQRKYQATILDLSRQMTHIRNLPELLKTISTTMVYSAKLSFCAFYIKEPVYKSFQLKIFHPEMAKQFFPELIPLELPALAKLAQEKKTLLSEELGNLNLTSGLVVPFIIEDELIGFMLLGQKQKNLSYTPDDILVFESISYSTALAIENCRFWKEIEDRQRKARLREMDAYSFALAHEIDNPMQVILGEGWLLKNVILNEMPDSEKKQETLESFDYIMEAAKRVSGMVKAIGEFKQPVTGEMKPLRIDEVIESFERLYIPQFKGKGVYFEKFNYLKQPTYINGEKPSLMQVLVILANNSLHAMKEIKEKRVQLKIDSITNEWVRIEFNDNGYGIKRDLLELIFTPFTTTKASSEGTGMGLYNAKMIIDRHKGRIWAESAGPDNGTSLIIELPLVAAPTGETADETHRLY